MSRLSPLQPLSADQFGFSQAAHLLSRAGFGGTRQQIQSLADMGLDGAVDYLVDYESISTADLPDADFDPDIYRNPTPQERRERQANRDNPLYQDRQRALYQHRQDQDHHQAIDLERWWLARMVATPRPLEEKLTLLWHGHFASSQRSVNDSYLMFQQNQFFRKHANGSFADLVLGIVQDPAMLKYLNNNANRKARPNENLARELMELFTLGEGNYTEEDIRQGARALTGYTYNDNDFQFNQRQFDDGEKTILGQQGPWDGQGFARILLARPDCRLFVAYKLYRHFVADVDDGFSPAAKAAITQLAQVVTRHRYQLKPVLKTLFKSRMFHDTSVVGNQIKSPAQLLAGTLRTFNAPMVDIALLNDAMHMMGQRLFNPPSVAGWYGGRSWVNTSTLLIRQNLCTYILTGKQPYRDGWNVGQITYDPQPLLEGLAQPTPHRLVDHLLETTLATPLADDRRAVLTNYLAGRADSTGRDAIIGLLLLITALPEYQLC